MAEDAAADETPAGDQTAEADEIASDADETAAEADGTEADMDGTEADDGEAAAADEASDCKADSDGAAFGSGSFRPRHGGVLNWRRGRSVSARRRSRGGRRSLCRVLGAAKNNKK